MGTEEIKEEENTMVTKKTWEEFRNSKMLWMINRTLHIFGWSIVFAFDGKDLKEVYPARVKYRGFDEDTETDGFIGISEYMKANANTLEEEAKS